MNLTPQFCDILSEIKAGYPDFPYQTAMIWLHSGEGVCVCVYVCVCVWWCLCVWCVVYVYDF